jgi:hypothetical protein
VHCHGFLTHLCSSTSLRRQCCRKDHRNVAGSWGRRSWGAGLEAEMPTQAHAGHHQGCTQAQVQLLFSCQAQLLWGWNLYLFHSCWALTCLCSTHAPQPTHSQSTGWSKSTTSWMSRTPCNKGDTHLPSVSHNPTSCSLSGPALAYVSHARLVCLHAMQSTPAVSQGAPTAAARDASQHPIYRDRARHVPREGDQPT